jgi:hypothetical protein
MVSIPSLIVIVHTHVKYSHDDVSVAFNRYSILAHVLWNTDISQLGQAYHSSHHIIWHSGISQSLIVQLHIKATSVISYIA